MNTTDTQPPDAAQNEAGRLPATAKESPPPMAAGADRKQEAEALVELKDAIDQAIAKGVRLWSNNPNKHGQGSKRYLRWTQTLAEVGVEVDEACDKATAAN